MTNMIHIISGDLWAGAEVQVFHTIFNLHRQYSFFSCVVIVFNDGILSSRLQEAGIKCIVIDETKNNGLKMLWVMCRWFVGLKPKIVHVHAYKEHIFGKLACLLSHSRAKIVRTFHGMSEPPKGLSFFRSLKPKVVHKIEKFFMKNCNIIAVSKDLEEFLSSSFPNASVTQIYNGMPVPEMDPSCIVRVRREYGIDARTFWIGSVARLEKIKNLEMLINVGNELKKNGISFKISIFGIGSQKEYLESRIAQNDLQNLVRLEGFEKDIMPVLMALDVFALCSFHEGLPMSLLEAMFAETPVVCTSVGGIKEVVTNNISGCLVPLNDVSAFCKAIIRVKEDITFRDKLISNAKKRVQDRFAIQNTNMKLKKFYNKIISK
ncbi:MAG: hypothetical protein B6I30_03550 [Desulfobacteraceae bacterium 4572_187]|nr:MAG: hypothetical protein B6I30_03550 [Desulfobacteraceae bacterium 4572_187]